MTRESTLGAVLVGGFLVLGSGARPGDGMVDRHYVAMPPAYPSPSSGFLPLPSAGTAPVFLAPGTVPGQPVWRPARTEAVFGLDALGHVTSALEHTPGRFVSPDDPSR